MNFFIVESMLGRMNVAFLFPKETHETYETSDKRAGGDVLGLWVWVCAILALF